MTITIFSCSKKNILKSVIQIIFLFFVICPQVLAKWVFITDSTDGANIYFNLPHTKKNNYPQMWIMRNYKSGSRDLGVDILYFSEKNLYEFDCAAKKFRLIHLVQYSGELGSGKIVNTLPSELYSEWNYVVPDTISEIELNVACKN